MAFEASVHAKAIELVRLAVEMTTEAGSGHPSSAASLAHLVTVLLYNHMRYLPSVPHNGASDRLVLSEGHACPIVYAAGADLGIAIGENPEHLRPMTKKDAMRLREIDSPLDGHPNPAEGFPFFPAPTGSLGQGLSIAAGLALAARLDRIPKRIFCIIGDGESREGQVWEALDFLHDEGLSAVCPIFNSNFYGQSDKVSEQQSAEVNAAKLRAARFEVQVIDGHDPDQIRGALEEHARLSQGPDSRPFAIVARTVKGWGIPLMQGKGWHGKPVAREELKKALADLEETAARVGAKWTEGDLAIPPITAKVPLGSRAPGEVPSFRAALKKFGKEDLLAKGKLAPRRAYGIALRALGHADPRVVALDGDVSNSTFSQEFRDDPELTERFFECRIAEQNMCSAAAGLAAGGKLPFASTFGKFLLRAADQAEMAMIGRFNLKLVGSHVGVSPASDGPSQMGLADVAFFHAFSGILRDDGRPFFHILQPADAHAAYALTVAMASHDGPCYLRTIRPDVAFIYGEGTTFSIGGHHVLAEGRDLLIASAGLMLHESLAALEKLRPAGIEATLVDLYSLPIQEEALVRLAGENGGRVLSVEDNYCAGLGSALAGALAAAGGNHVLRQLYVRKFPKSGRSHDDVLRHVGLSADDIVKTAQEMLAGVTR